MFAITLPTDIIYYQKMHFSKFTLCGHEDFHLKSLKSKQKSSIFPNEPESTSPQLWCPLCGREHFHFSKPSMLWITCHFK